MTLRKKGFSLIEVVIALAIFVIGALTVIRIFPTGISLVEKSGNEQRAANLNRSIVAKRLNTKTVPDGIFEGDFQSVGPGNYLDNSRPFNGAVSGSAKFNNSLPKGIKLTELSGSALDRFQAIRGEKSIVQDSASGQYILTQSSISPNRTAAVYREFTVENVKVAANGTLDWTNANKVGSSDIFDPLNTTAATPIDPTKYIFYATYRYKDGTHIWGAEEEAIPTNATTLKRTASVVPSLIEVKARQFMQTADFSAIDGPAKARCGLIEITGAGAANGITLGETVSVDYVTDWYWILEETTAPTSVDTNLFGNLDPNDFRQVELSLPFVRPRSSQRFATLMMSNGGIGEHYASTYNGNFIPATTKVVVPADSSKFRAALREGKIAFDITTTTPSVTPPQLPPVAAPIIRVAYRTQDDWVEQLSVSAKTYLRNSSLNGPNPTDWYTNAESWRNYELENNVLVFQPSEAGKSVRVTYNYDSTAGSGTRTELITISGEITDHIPLKVARARIVPPNGGTVTSILSVRGASITSRTAWMTNDRYSHNLLTSMRSDS